MINLMLSSTSFLIILILISSNNPINTSFYLLVSSSIIFFILNINISSVWMPLIFFLLFAGGILIMFIILASVMPNENAMNTNISFITIPILGAISTIYPTNISPVQGLSSQINSFLMTSTNLIFITVIIIIYFFYSIGINTEEEHPIRSVTCWNNANFVN